MPTFLRRMSAPAANPEVSAPLFRRILAAMGVALLLLLTASAASPALHQWLHGESAHADSDNCAVVLFASGITLATAIIAIEALQISWEELRPRSVEEIFLTAPHYLRQPERGPPVC